MKVNGEENRQHNGKGTATLIDKRWNHVSARKIYNSQKNVTDIIVDENKKRLVIAGIHTETGSKKGKWEIIEMELNSRKI